MKNNPILIFTGLAAAAVVAVAGATKERWMPGDPQTVAGENASGEAVTVTEPAPEEQKLAATEQATVTEEPAATSSQDSGSQTEAATEQPTATESKPVVKPSFDTVRVEKGGEALIAGRAEPGSEVIVMLDGKAIGKAITNADGAFVLTPDAPLPTGTGALSIESKTSDQAAVQSETSVAVIVPAEEKKEVLVAVVSPDEPTKVLQKETAAATESTTTETSTTAEPAATTEITAAAPLSLDAVDYDESGNIVFSGSGRPGSTVRVYVDNSMAGEAKAGGDGRWTFAGSSPIEAGEHTLRADGIDGTGAVLSRVELPFYREEPSKVASAAEQTQTAATTTTTEPVTADSAATETAGGGTSAADSATTEVAATETATDTSQTAATETAAADSETVTAATTTLTETSTTETSTAESATAETTASAESATRADTSADTAGSQTVVSATTTATEIAKPKDGRIVIQPGNNLWRISRVIYGSGTKYTVIFESNKDQIRNPHLIFPGQVFMTPDVVPPEKIDPTRRDSLKPEEGGSSG